VLLFFGKLSIEPIQAGFIERFVHSGHGHFA